MFSNLAFPSNNSRHLSKDSSLSNASVGRTNLRRTSKATSRASSPSSASTAPSSSQDNTVRRRRRSALAATESVISDSPNPLRAPPSSLLGPRQNNSAVSESTESIRSTIEISVGSLDIPIVSFAELHYLTFAGNDSSKKGSPCSVWVVIEIRCSSQQGADDEPLMQKQSSSKSGNHPGFLRNIALTLSPSQGWQITAVLGKLTASMLSSDEITTAIVLVTSDKQLFSSTRTSPRKEHGRNLQISQRNRPTSDLLNEDLLNQLLGTSKRTSPAKEGKIEDRMLTVEVAYYHSLFPPRHQISYEEIVTVTQATICDTQHKSSQKHNQNRVRGSRKDPGVRRLTSEETEIAAEGIIRVLREGLYADDNAVYTASPNAINAGHAVTLLNDFLAEVTTLAPDTIRTLEMLKFRYSIVMHNDNKPAASPKRYNPFERRKEDRRKSLDPESPRRTPQGADGGRRNAFEIKRREIDSVLDFSRSLVSSKSSSPDFYKREKELADVTNRTRCRGHNLLSGGIDLLVDDDTSDTGKDNVIPPPLFSPKRGSTLVHSSSSECGSTQASARTPKKIGHQALHHHYHLQTKIGLARFYAAEVQEMARQAFGGATTTCHHRSELSHESMENREGIEDEEAANDKAKMIWERMRISSEGSGTSANSTEVRYSDESADEAERARECKMVGAPWLA